ncbi:MULTISPECIES: hydroxymethylbilane synthase [Micromonospora]|uniref:Porphobilinogen deaminase n=1 Tax=Micromonospora aurantiaca (nom. illeg.) TaxID=47850 RepID=A0A1C6TGG7_9ACTN|nr:MULTISPECIES: hydroxymethylbilane synthase [Micromonospora]ADL49147.1 porphobilinogen deaminase [Micromonospora aurantiaca ATCC 27029]ADU08373.1 porphobilinogen deaminase [Micromonospora sp. L5]AXH89318.1 hydroxymethylbilane synthase [Micromonospora aurantiaca]KAB1109191.1 hydroxymethylbilane synthase [Micromonospora aurantiaca]MBC9003509.1 hydroxymethylbilane synthase [Micromonospora aurantiaca]
MTAPLRLGTRGSALAMAQSGHVAEALTAATGRPVELVEVVTAGDRSTAPVQRLGVGVFVSALRDALTAGEIDFAVHSYKDLPTAAAPGLHVAAVPPRQDPRDALVATNGRTLAELPPGARVGTGALRRIAQLHALGMQLEVSPIRGNVDTRLGRVLGPDADLDAVVLARAGLNRIGRADVITETLDPMLMLPAPAQGALAVECRADDQDVIELLALLDHAPSRAAITAERALLATLEAGCSAPVAAYAVLAEGEPTDEGDVNQEIYLRGAVISPDGTRDLRLSRTGTPADAAEIGKALAAELLELGADSILGQDAQAGPGTQQLGSTE